MQSTTVKAKGTELAVWPAHSNLLLRSGGLQGLQHPCSHFLIGKLAHSLSLTGVAEVARLNNLQGTAAAEAEAAATAGAFILHTYPQPRTTPALQGPLCKGIRGLLPMWPMVADVLSFSCCLLVARATPLVHSPFPSLQL